MWHWPVILLTLFLCGWITTSPIQEGGGIMGGNLIEDDFDDGDVTGWTAVGGGPAPAISAEQAHTPGSSVKATDSFDTLRQAFTGQSEVWVRAYVYPTAIAGNTEVLLLKHSGSTALTHIRLSAGSVVYVWNSIGAQGYTSSENVVMDSWNLLEIRLKVHAATGEVDVWVNGILGINESGRNTGGTDCDALDFGQGNGNGVVYFDDVGVSSTGRLGHYP